MASMNIQVVGSVGEGSTLLSSFDNALQNAGVSNYNLIPLSSVIPPNSKITKITRFQTPSSEFGYKLYLVMAEKRSNQTGKYIAAGIGWYQLDGGRGFFVEHEVVGETKVAVKSDIDLRIRNTLKDMCKFRKITFDISLVRKAVSITKVKGKPACAMVLAIYKSEGWE